MSQLNAEQLISAQKNALGVAQRVATIAIDSVEKYAELNIAAAKAALLETGDDFLSTLSANSATDSLAAQASLVKPLFEKSISYGRSVYAIASEANTALADVAEAQYAQWNDVVLASVENLVKNAPAGSEPLVNLFKSSMAAGQNAINTAKQSAKKAVAQAEQQAASITDTALQSVKTTSRKK